MSPLPLLWVRGKTRNGRGRWHDDEARLSVWPSIYLLLCHLLFVFMAIFGYCEQSKESQLLVLLRASSL